MTQTELTPERLEEEIRSFLAVNFPLGEDLSGLGSDESLQDVGILDSTGVVELVVFLEDTYGITVPDDDLLPENLDSVGNIVRYVGDRLA